MAEPLQVAIAADTWVKVATAVQHGVVWPQNREGASLWFNFVNTAQAAPVGFDGTEKPLTSDYASISHDEDIDVYIYRRGSAGVVTVVL